MKTLTKSMSKKTPPTLGYETVPPKRGLNADRRPREYLTCKEVERLMTVAKSAERRYGLRDATMMLICFRHGLRVTELCTLTRDVNAGANGDQRAGAKGSQ